MTVTHPLASAALTARTGAPTTTATSAAGATSAPAPRTCRMHRIRPRSIVALVLAVVFTLVIALQLLPGAGAPAAVGGVSAEASVPTLPVFVVCAFAAVLVTAAVLVSAAVSRRVD